MNIRFFHLCGTQTNSAMKILVHIFFYGCVRTYLKVHYSAIKKNTFESGLMRWMKLEPIIQSEVSQKEKHKYSILTHIYGI